MCNLLAVQEMITIKADRNKLIYLGMANVLNLQPNTMTTGFDPKTSDVTFAVDKATL
jgi:hypothetical protein